VTLSGKGQCLWEDRPITFTSDTVQLLGEDVQLVAEERVFIARGDSRAGYTAADTGSSIGPGSFQDAITVQSTGLHVRVDSPDDAEPSPFYETLGGRSDTAVLDVTIAWRCLAPGTGPSPIPTPRITPQPTPVCPTPRGATQAWSVLLGRGSTTTKGVAGTGSFVTCTRSGDVDAFFTDPPTGVTLGAAGRLSLTGDGPIEIFDIEGAGYSPWGTEGADPRDLGTYQPSPGVFEVDAPPAGDWTVTVYLGINELQGGIVRNNVWYFRVTVQP
jgi:hypothetical protein